MSEKGFVYILKDSHFRRGVKIGRAHDVDKRMRPMLTANPWLSVYIKVETSKWIALEKAVHNVIKLVAKTKQVKNSEFYLIEPEKAKKIIAAVEERAREQGKRAVVAVCNPEGNPIAVHVMDGAFLVSYEVAVKKAYTSVAVKMSTMELSALCQPGGTFYGLQALDKVITFGGGIPLYHDGIIVGGLGVSGGTGEEDHDLALYGAAVFQTL